MRSLRLFAVARGNLFAAATCAALVLLASTPFPDRADAQERSADASGGIVATGRGVVEVRPDRAIVRLGATAQNERADLAQRDVNRIVQRTVEALRDLGLEDDDLQTSGISLFPVYSNESYEPRDGGQPRVVSYRASNVVRARIDEIDRVGEAIDIGVREGANEIQGISFERIDPEPAKQEALRRAVAQARGKAEAIAQALGIRLGPLLEAAEAGSGPILPYATMSRMEMSQSATPVEPGVLEVEGSVTLRYGVDR